MPNKWDAQGRKFCKFCNCWFADNKISVDNHEKGASHQTNVEKALTRTRQEKQDMVAAEQAMLTLMQRIEAKAMKSFEEDARRDPFARNEMERVLEARGKLTRSTR